MTTQTPKPDSDAVVPENPGIECPLCKLEIEAVLEVHLRTIHTHEELASLVANYVQEREERGMIR